MATVIRVRQWFAVRVSDGWICRWRGVLGVQSYPFTFSCEAIAITAAREYLEARITTGEGTDRG